MGKRQACTNKQLQSQTISGGSAVCPSLTKRTFSEYLLMKKKLTEGKPDKSCGKPRQIKRNQKTFTHTNKFTKKGKKCIHPLSPRKKTDDGSLPGAGTVMRMVVLPQPLARGVDVDVPDEVSPAAPPAGVVHLPHIGALLARTRPRQKATSPSACDPEQITTLSERLSQAEMLTCLHRRRRTICLNMLVKCTG